MKKLLPFVSLAILLGMFIWLPKLVHAQTTNYAATETWNDSSCTGSVNGQQSSYVGLASGDTVNLTIVNSSSTQSLSVTVTKDGGSSSFTLGPNLSKPVKAYTVAQSLVVLAVSQSNSPSCSSQTNNFSRLEFDAGSGTLTCNISGNQVWNLGGTFTNIIYGNFLYRGSTYVEVYHEKGNTETIDGTEFSAQSTPQTYYLYNGTSSSAPLIGQATCPAKTVAATKTTTTTKTTTAAPTTTPPATSTTTSTTTTTPTQTPATPTTKEADTQQLNAQNANTKLSGSFWALFIIASLVGLFLVVSSWKVYQKAGRHGWIALIPVYNTWVIFEMGGKPGWWALLMFVPIVNIATLIMLIIAEIELARRFGKSALFGFFGLTLFGFIGWPILAFGKAQYNIAPATAEAEVSAETTGVSAI